jgi:hypothetical protein
MKNHIRLLILLFAALISVVSVRAQQPTQTTQVPSLASIPAGERFIYAKGGFSIALPQKPTETVVNEKDNRGMLFEWQFKEGVISVKSVEFFGGIKFTSEKDREHFLNGFIGVFATSDKVKSITGTPFTLGQFKGKTYSMLVLGQKAQVSVLLADDKYLEIMAMAYADAPNSETLVFKAANSVSLLPVPVK